MNKLKVRAHTCYLGKTGYNAHARGFFRALSKFVDPTTKVFDYERLHRVTKRITRNLNKVIDRNYYPVEEARNSNMKHRPIGIGV